VRADEKLTAFLELESAIRAGQNSSGLGPTLPAGWRLVTMADFNADGHPDYLLFNPTTQQSQNLVFIRSNKV